MQIENFVAKGKAHYDWKEMMASERHRERVNDILRTEELHQAKQLAHSRRELEKALEYPLTQFDVDFRTGTVYWPTLVAGPRYAKYRAEVNHLMADMMRNGAISARANRERLAQVCHDFRRQLRADFEVHLAKQLDSVQAEYAAAERLIKGLRYTPVVMSQAAAIDTVSMR
jgi:hypothetical protein